MNENRGVKADAGKTRPLLLQKDMAPALYLVQRVLDYGIKKYTRGGWTTVAGERYDDAQRRHQQLIDLGAQFDEESGLLHRAHQIAGLLMLFMHELGTDISIDEVLKFGKFSDPPQDHKTVPQAAPAATPTEAPSQIPWAVVPRPEPSNKRHVHAALAGIGDYVLAKASRKYLDSASLIDGHMYKVLDISPVLEGHPLMVIDEAGRKVWAAVESFV